MKLTGRLIIFLFWLSAGSLSAAVLNLTADGFAQSSDSDLITSDMAHRAAVMDLDRQLFLIKGCKLEIINDKPVLSSAGNTVSQLKKKAVYKSVNWCRLESSVDIGDTVLSKLSFKYKFASKISPSDVESLTSAKKEADIYILDFLKTQLQKNSDQKVWTFSLFAVEKKMDTKGVKGQVSYILKNPSSR